MTDTTNQLAALRELCAQQQKTISALYHLVVTARATENALSDVLGPDARRDRVYELTGAISYLMFDGLVSFVEKVKAAEPVEVEFAIPALRSTYRLRQRIPGWFDYRDYVFAAWPEDADRGELHGLDEKSAPRDEPYKEPPWFLMRGLESDKPLADTQPSAEPDPAPPTDKPKITMIDGSPVTPDHREINPNTGMQKGYVVLSEEERSLGFVRPIRHSYVHDKCSHVTTMNNALAETYARNPNFYTGTYCSGCRAHFPVGERGEFMWAGTNIRVGT